MSSETIVMPMQSHASPARMRRTNRCGNCHELGHNRTRCPIIRNAEVLPAIVQQPPPRGKTNRISTFINRILIRRFYRDKHRFGSSK